MTQFDQMLLEVSLILEVPIPDIEICASFVQNGGNSLSATTFARNCQSHGVPLSVESILSSPSISDLLELGFQMSSSGDSDQWSLQSRRSKYLPRKEDDIKGASTADSCSKTPLPSDSEPCRTAHLLARTPGKRSYPMTEMQLSLIYGSQKSHNTNIISYYETYPPDDVSAVRHAWTAVIDSEPIFRTSFVYEEGEGFLEEQEKAEFRWSETMVSSQEEFDASVGEDCSDTSIGLSFRVITLLATPHHSGKSTIIWRVHHALIDGYSCTLVIRKLRAAVAGIPISSGPSFAQFAGELHALQQQSKDSRQKFWLQKQEKYSSAAGKLLLAAPLTRAHLGDNASHSVAFSLPLAEISAFAQQLGVTLASVYYAAWALALSVHVGFDTVVFGVVLSGRDLPIAGVDKVVGPVINMLPFHIKVVEGADTGDYLHRVFSDLVELMPLQCSRSEDGFNRRFDSAVVTQNEYPTEELKGRDLLHHPYDKVVSDVPLYVLIQADGTARLNYHKNEYDHTDMVSLRDYFCNAIRSLLIPHRTVSTCLESLMSWQVRKRLRTLGNCLSSSTVALSKKEDLVTLFEKAAAGFPHAVAVERGNDFLSYAQLNASAERIAHRISDMIRPGEVVCVHADRSIQWIIAIYGVLKAGAVYCPFDESWPLEIRDRNFEIARSRLFLAPDLAGKAFRPSHCEICISVEELLLAGSTGYCEGAIPRPRYPMPEKVAYLCFTSGSTGLPKGVMSRHESLVAFQDDLEVRLLAAPGKKIAQVMSPAFDGSIHEIFSTLSYGATLVLGNAVDPLGHLNLAESAVLTPSIARVLDPADFPKLRTVYLVGEVVPQTVNDRWAAHKTLYNMYGPTEATCGATIQRLHPNQPVTIGTPNPSMRVYVLDFRQNLVPPGIIGEIYLAGVQIADGYVGRSMETAHAFIPDKLCNYSGSRMYKTGDHGYWNQEGDLVCLGRKDRQIKLRGFRMDLDDLENRMLKAAGVVAVALTQRKDFLVAMVQPSSLDLTIFRSEAARLLPVQALPRHIIAVDQFPLTAAGKLDYATIANTQRPAGLSSPTSVQSPVLKLMIAIWREVLGLAPDVPIGSESSFVDLGGHSLQQMLLSRRIADVFGCPASLRMVLGHPTLGELTEKVTSLDPRTSVANQKQYKQGDELSSIEKDWWNKYEMGLGSSAFNVNFVSTMGKEVDLQKLTLAWNTVLARHRILSTRYTPCSEFDVKRSYTDHPPRVDRIRSMDMWQEINRPFDLRLGNLINVSISADCMLVKVSHIICDLTTLRTLLHEVAILYRGSCLAEIKRTFTERVAVKTTASFESLSFWSEYLLKAPNQQYVFPKIRRRTTYGGTSEVCKISQNLFHQMVSYSVREKVTFHQISLAAVALALQPDSGPHDVVLGAPYLNRDGDDDMDTVGLFLEPLPIRVRYPSGRKSRAESGFEHESFIHSVRTSSQAALSHAIPWIELLRYLQIKTDFPEHPLFNVMVTFQDDRREMRSSLPGCKPLYTWCQGAKFYLMTEFQAVNQDTLLLRIEYDTNCIEMDEIELLQEKIVAAMEMLFTGVGYDDMRKRMRHVNSGNAVHGFLERETVRGFFGVEVDKL